jgi:hypothetical protein
MRAAGRSGTAAYHPHTIPADRPQAPLHRGPSGAPDNRVGGREPITDGGRVMWGLEGAADYNSSSVMWRGDFVSDHRLSHGFEGVDRPIGSAVLRYGLGPPRRRSMSALTASAQTILALFGVTGPRAHELDGTVRSAEITGSGDAKLTAARPTRSVSPICP